MIWWCYNGVEKLYLCMSSDQVWNSYYLHLPSMPAQQHPTFTEPGHLYLLLQQEHKLHVWNRESYQAFQRRKSEAGRSCMKLKIFRCSFVHFVHHTHCCWIIRPHGFQKPALSTRRETVNLWKCLYKDNACIRLSYSLFGKQALITPPSPTPSFFFASSRFYSSTHTLCHSSHVIWERWHWRESLYLCSFHAVKVEIKI